MFYNHKPVPVQIEGHHIVVGEDSGLWAVRFLPARRHHEEQLWHPVLPGTRGIQGHLQCRCVARTICDNAIIVAPGAGTASLAGDSFTKSGGTPSLFNNVPYFR